MPRPASGVPLRDRNVGSAGQDGSAEPRFLVVGHVRAPHGVHGDLRVQILTDFPERFSPDAEIWLGLPPERHIVQRVRMEQDQALITLAGLNDRDSVERFRGTAVLIPREQAMPLPEDTYYIHDIVGLEVWTDAGERLGTVSEVMELPANDVYVVDSPQGEILLPAIADVVLSIDLPAGRMTVHLLPGLV
jgi:16S rRNA processing protein RimM